MAKSPLGPDLPIGDGEIKPPPLAKRAASKPPPTSAVDVPIAVVDLPAKSQAEQAGKAARGRPKGSKNKPKAEIPAPTLSKGFPGIDAGPIERTQVNPPTGIDFDVEPLPDPPIVLPVEPPQFMSKNRHWHLLRLR